MALVTVARIGDIPEGEARRFEVDGHTLSTWCAWDTLFIPEILGCSARVTSADPENGETVHLVVTPGRIEVGHAR